MKVEELQAKIDELKLDKDDINEKGELTASGLQKKKNAGYGKIKETLKFLGDNEKKFINYFNELDIYFANKKNTFNDSLK